MVEVTYSYYKDEYFGDMIQESEFKKLIKRAEPYVSARTFGKADEVTDTSDTSLVIKVKDALCAVAEIIKAHTSDDGVEHGEVVSESVGGSWSRSFANSTDKSGMIDIITNKLYILLSNTGLLYGGD